MKCNPIPVFKVHVSSQDFEWRRFYLDDRFLGRWGLQISPGFADPGGGHEEVTSGEWAGDAMVTDRCQSHGGDAATLFAVRGSSELAGGDLG